MIDRIRITDKDHLFAQLMVIHSGDIDPGNLFVYPSAITSTHHLRLPVRDIICPLATWNAAPSQLADEALEVSQLTQRSLFLVN
jgi:hypothetical protein